MLIQKIVKEKATIKDEVPLLRYPKMIDVLRSRKRWLQSMDRDLDEKEAENFFKEGRSKKTSVHEAVLVVR